MALRRPAPLDISGHRCRSAQGQNPTGGFESAVPAVRVSALPDRFSDRVQVQGADNRICEKLRVRLGPRQFEELLRHVNQKGGGIGKGHGCRGGPPGERGQCLVIAGRRLAERFDERGNTADQCHPADPVRQLDCTRQGVGAARRVTHHIKVAHPQSVGQLDHIDRPVGDLPAGTGIGSPVTRPVHRDQPECGISGRHRVWSENPGAGSPVERNNGRLSRSPHSQNASLRPSLNLRSASTAGRYPMDGLRGLREYSRRKDGPARIGGQQQLTDRTEGPSGGSWQ